MNLILCLLILGLPVFCLGSYLAHYAVSCKPLCLSVQLNRRLGITALEGDGGSNKGWKDH